jgi:predicted regulator of Ras-like GTPase activity (Roadblock/LC7/MglB family)
MDAAEAISRLLEVSDDVRAVVVFERGGEPIASNLSDDGAAEAAALADAMLAYGETMRESAAVQQLRAVTQDGDVYLRRDGDRAVLAVAAAESMPGLIQHDLRALLGSLPRRRARSKAGATT